MFLSILQIIRY